MRRGEEPNQEFQAASVAKLPSGRLCTIANIESARFGLAGGCIDPKANCGPAWRR
jgi:hypothetical protein